MTDKTISPDEGSYLLLEATEQMQYALTQEEIMISKSLIQVSDQLQESGFMELFELNGIYKGGYGTFQITYAEGMNYNSVNNTWQTYNTHYDLADPGWGNTNDNTETQAAAGVDQQYRSMIQDGLTSFQKMSTSMMSQASENDQALNQFAGEPSNNNTYGANLLASSLA